MTTITHLPEIITPGREARVTFTRTETGSNFIRVWCTSAPPGSGLARDLDALEAAGRAPQRQVLVYSNFGGSAHPWRQKFDKGGRYTLIAQEYVRGGSGGPAYQGDPNAADKETKLGAEATLELYVSQRVTQLIGPASDRATLVLWVNDSAIITTTPASHGEATPAIVNPTSDRARLAIGSAPVKSALAALAGTPVDDAVGDPAAIVVDLLSRWNAHVASDVFHDEPDTENQIHGMSSASTPTSLRRLAGTVLRAMRRHMANDAGNGVDTGSYHSGADWANAPLLASASSLAEAYASLAELHRCFEGHRVSGVHDEPDETGLAPLGAELLELHAAFLSELAASAPTIPAFEQSGAFDLRTRAGFQETPL